MRRVTVSQYKKETKIGIREYYEKDGAMLPGKKGISLSLAQWECVKSKLCGIDACIEML
jgi:Transcriptional Coactivator p15 (PC4)